MQCFEHYNSQRTRAWAGMVKLRTPGVPRRLQDFCTDTALVRQSATHRIPQWPAPLGCYDRTTTTSRRRMNSFQLGALAAAAVLLTGCGGGDDTPARGSLVEAPSTVGTLTTAQFDAGPLNALTGPAKCDVKVVALNYHTIGPKGEQTNASAAMLVPVASATCPAGGQPLLAYAPERDAQKSRSLANPADAETFLLAAMYAAQGYVVVATDYLGYAKSSFPYHPYLHADSEANSVIDSLRAARAAASAVSASLSGKVMFAGYSDGGHSSMAAQRAAERDNAAEFNIVASAHLAGPYNLSGMLQSSYVIAGYQVFVPYAVNAWQSIYGNVYTDINTVYRMPYASYISTLLPSPTLTFTTLFSAGPSTGTFWLPGAVGETPTQARDLVFQAAFITDLQTNNNGGFIADAKLNNTLGWNPKAKTLLCGGAGDPTVPPALHRDVAYADFQTRGLTNVTKIDVDAMVQATYGPNGVAPAPGSAQFETYYGNYHVSYEPPFCHAGAKALFDTVK